MEDDILDEELSIMYEETERVTVLDSKTLLKPIKNLKVRKPLTIHAGRSVQEAVGLMQQKYATCLLVTEENKLTGILTERDIITKVLAKGKDIAVIKVKEIMTPNPESFQPEDSIAFILNAMHVGGYRHVPVINDRNEPLAIVSVRDIIGFIAEHFSQEILNLPPKPIRTASEREGA